MNRRALFVLQNQILLNPLISIDDVFLGICMFKAGLEHRLFNIPEMRCIGIHKSTNLCDIARAVSVHYAKFEYDCIIERLYNDAEKCFWPAKPYIEASECFAKYWYRKPLAPPILSGPNYQRCGPQFNNSRCSTNEKDWKIQEPENGPCCSPMGYCIPATWDCTCENCLDFGELTRCRFIFQFHTVFNPCGKVTNELSSKISLKTAERSEVKSAKRSFASKIKILRLFDAKLYFAL